MNSKLVKYLLAALLSLAGAAAADDVFAQEPDSSLTARRDSLDLLSKSSLERPAFTTAKDSIVTDFSDGKRLIYYYGGATVSYQGMQLTADYIEYDMSTNTVHATGRKDPSGEWVGLPEMTEGGQSYKMYEL